MSVRLNPMQRQPPSKRAKPLDRRRLRPRPDRASTSRAPGSTVHQPAITLRSGDSSPLNADCAVTANTAVGKEAEAHADQRTQRGRRTGLAELADPGFEQAVNHLGLFRFAFFGAGLEVGFGLFADVAKGCFGGVQSKILAAAV